MQANKSSFSWEIKKEIINNTTTKNEITAFLNGLIYSNAIYSENGYTLQIKNQYILDKLFTKLDKIQVSYTKSKTAKTKFFISKNNFKLKAEINFQDYLTFFFAGVFCGSGNISSRSSTSYHLEISSHYYENIIKIMNKLNLYEFNFQYFQRNSKHIIYVKKQDKLLDFLSAIGAKKSWFNLQNWRIQKDFENVSNRINNIDISNIQKIAKSSLKHIKNITYLFEHNLESCFSENELVFFNLKLENKWSSLSELSEILSIQHNIVISKSGLNHWLRKLNTIVEIDKTENKKSE
ncbi:DNA-binding protein WhiA [Mycoplasma buteonis]|uniref:DNA-binding protein WhiA n=1 Tax=Mycoplasma buteonis TaxID=171280 RepID=UPI000568684F|nr:DNA-binding protein WhiA [Mycoplasma buteonis]